MDLLGTDQLPSLSSPSPSPPPSLYLSSQSEPSITPISFPPSQQSHPQLLIQRSQEAEDKHQHQQPQQQLQQNPEEQQSQQQPEQPQAQQQPQQQPQQQNPEEQQPQQQQQQLQFTLLRENDHLKSQLEAQEREWSFRLEKEREIWAQKLENERLVAEGEGEEGRKRVEEVEEEVEGLRREAGSLRIEYEQEVCLFSLLKFVFSFLFFSLLLFFFLSLSPSL